jgi:Ca2+-transporting ATPase
LTAGYLCNDALVDEEQTTGDPLEIALVQAAKNFGIDGRLLVSKHSRVTEFSFENERKRMSVVTKEASQDDNTSYHVWVKGAPESVISVSTRYQTDSEAISMDAQARQNLLEKVSQMAERGFRVIAFAEKRLPANPACQEEAENDLTFLGLAGLLDPPRAEVRDAIQSMQGSGIRSMMITGDHPLTSRAIARAVGLDGNGRVVSGIELDSLNDAELSKIVNEASIFARTTPEHKLRIVQTLQAQGERVAVTGDGVNDAPALTVADIGVAMGETGSDVAREAADIVLADDNYTTIANAVREGRALFANLKKGVRYYLTIKVALVSVMLLPILLQAPVPFAPVQIILMELFMDLAAAAAFVAEPAEGDLMRMPPRDPKAKFMDRSMMGSILMNAAGLFVAVSAVYLLAWYRGAGQDVAQTVAFVAWMIGHVLLAFNMRSERQPILQLGLGSNRMMLGWGGAVAVFLALISLVPVLQPLMKITPLTAAQWGAILLATFVGTFWIEARKLVTYRRRTCI